MYPRINLGTVARHAFTVLCAAMPFAVLGVFASMTGCTAIVAGVATAAGQRIADRAVDRGFDTVDQVTDDHLGPPRRRGTENASTVRRVEATRVAEAPRATPQTPPHSRDDTVPPPTESATVNAGDGVGAGAMTPDAAITAVPDAEQGPIASPESPDDDASAGGVARAKPPTPRQPIATGEELHDAQPIPWPR